MALKARAANGTVTTPLVIYESTVYPGITEEFCVPILVRESGLCFNSAVPGCGFVDTALKELIQAIRNIGSLRSLRLPVGVRLMQQLG